MEELVEREYIYHGRVLSLRLDTVRVSGGDETIREVVEHPGAVVIIALDVTGNVLLVRQYRHAVGKKLLEAPAGTVERDEGPEKAAPRELREETGYSAKRWELLARFFSSPGILTEQMIVYLARDLSEGKSQPEGDEELELEKVPLDQALDMVRTGEVQDAKTIVGLLLASDKLNRMES